jgi:hypothetical protein
MNTENGEKPKSWINQHPWWTAIIIFSVLGLISNATNRSSSTDTTATTPAPVVVPTYTLGQEVFLRVPNTSDPTQIICLAPNQAVYDQYTKALQAQDYQGVLDLQSTGMFCVGNGTEVKIIDTSAFMAEVRVVKGENKVDTDKVGSAGWTDKTFLSNQ